MWLLYSHFLKTKFVLFCVFSVILTVVGCNKDKSDSSNDKTQKGVQAADCIRKYDKDGCNICNRVALTDEWECPTGVSCPDQSAEQANKNSNQCLQVCVTKTDEGGCNLCRLSYDLDSWGFSCTEIGCAEEDKKDANKCKKDMSVKEFNILTNEDFFDSK